MDPDIEKSNPSIKHLYEELAVARQRVKNLQARIRRHNLANEESPNQTPDNPPIEIDLDNTEELYAASVRMAQVGYCIWDDKEKNYIDVSEEWANIFGYSRQEFLAEITSYELDEALVFPADRERYRIFLEKYWSALSTDFEYRIFHRDGRLRHVVERIQKPTVNSSRPDAMLIIMMDITERKIAEAKMIQSSKLATLGEMSAGIAHELNQPLHTISLAASNIMHAIESEPPDIAVVGKKLERIKSQIERASSITENLRMFGREATEDDHIIDLRTAVTSALGLIGEQLKLAGITLEKHFDDQPFLVRGHPIRLEQVILNLLTNALHQLEEIGNKKKQIDIKLFLNSDKGITLLVSDSGGGIPDDILPSIFEPFVTTKGFTKGTGLGLSIVHGIVAGMKGDIKAYNTDEGACFEINLPTPE